MKIKSVCGELSREQLGTVTSHEECGFSGAEYFSSLFKKQIGISPLAFRHASVEVIGELVDLSNV